MKFFLLVLIFLSSLVHAEEEVPVVILGGGVAAMTSATYLARGGITPVVITGPYPGGAILQSTSVQNWPGEMDIIGHELAGKIQKQAQKSGATFLPEIVVQVDFSKRPFTITTQKLYQNGVKKRVIKAHSCILALGATPNFLGVPGETGERGYWLRGVYNCAVCDGALYKGKTVAVVGGGDSALTEAQYLSNIANKVVILVRKEQFRTVEEKRKSEILKRPNIEVLYNTSIQEIKGNGQKLTHLVLNNKKELPVDALFLAIGSKPNSDLLKGQVDLDEKGYVALKNHQETSIPGVYAIGDLVDPDFKQAITAAGDAAKAALQAQKFLSTYQAEKKDDSISLLLKPVSIREVSSQEELEKEIKTSKVPILVYFSSPSCFPCRTFSLFYEEWSRELGNKIKFLKVDAAHGLELFQKYQVTSVPSVFVFDEKGAVIRKTLDYQGLAEVGTLLEELKSNDKIDARSLR